MNKPLLILCAALPLAVAQQQPTAGSAAGLLGRWRSVKTSQGGIGAVYEFHADGTVDFSPGAIVEIPYRVEGNQLILPPATTTGPEVKAVLSWPVEHVMRIAMLGAITEYQRQGPPVDARDPLLGEWLTFREMDGHRMPEQWLFYPGGKGLLVIRFTTDHGRYSLTNGNLAATFARQGELDGAIGISEGVLSISRSGGRVTKLARY
jgi:hypothetical protein